MACRAAILAMAVGFAAGCGEAMQGTGGGGTPSGSAGGPSSTATGGTGSIQTSGTTDGEDPVGNGVYEKPVVVANPPPPPVSGGTLLAIAHGHQAAVADPDRDQVNIVDLDQAVVTKTIVLSRGDEPGRLVEDAAGLVHVALRGSGAVATLDPAAGTERFRRVVCPHPRGLAYDARAGDIHVACAGGELVTLEAAGGDPVRRLALDRDLRDVVIDGDRLLVSRFRAAELLVVEADGQISARLRPDGIGLDQDAGAGDLVIPTFSPAVAWRTIPAPGGGALMVFQEEQTSEIQIQIGGYAGCAGIVRTAVGLLRRDGTRWTVSNLPQVVLAVDIAVATDGSMIELAAAGIPAESTLPSQPTVDIVPPWADGGTTPNVPARCGGPPPLSPAEGQIAYAPPISGQVVAVAYDAAGRLLVQTREPSLVVGDRVVTLPGAAIDDTGHELFHLATFGGIACASCHPEGREDGHVWKFAGLGPRRTQSLGGGTLGTGPFHWSGDMKTFAMLARDVFNKRMLGPSLQPANVQALADWIDKTPAWRASASDDPDAAQRGRALFVDPAVGCAACHVGPAMTNRAIVDVGTGAPFKVPSLLGVAFRAPYLHNGCASTLADRFGACGGGDKHGQVSALTDSQRADLVAYLGTL
jgi:hypothetical protein